MYFQNIRFQLTSKGVYPYSQLWFHETQIFNQIG